MDDDTTPLEYAVYGVLAAAKHETGPEGGRRLSRIHERLNYIPEEAAVAAALAELIRRGWVYAPDPVLGMIHYSIKDPGGRDGPPA